MRITLIVSIAAVVSLAVFSFARDGTRSHTSCKYCGMDREAFGYSKMLLEYTDGTSVGTCSLHCTTLELSVNSGMVPCSVKVGDYQTRKLIDAYKAYWVVGGDKQGVMTGRAKWAFEKESDATEFVKNHGGARAPFYDAVKAAYEDLYNEVRTTLERTDMRKTRGLGLCDQNKD